MEGERAVQPASSAKAAMTFPFSNSYVRLPERFYARVAPTSAATPKLIRLNRELALQLGLDPDWLSTPEGVEILAGKRIAEGSEPIAMAYAGHQFGNFVPQLGDGRAILLGEVVDKAGQRRDIQLKGSGRTPYSRRGDGKAALGPVLREYVVSEAMAALGISTTRSLAAATTGATVARETILPGAVLVRVASSHIRFGTFQFFAARGDVEGVRVLADHVIARHYPEAAEAARPYRALVDAVIAAQAELVARWLMVGFIHGVMNTDNMSIAGETIDYGPCAFMDAYDPATVFSSIDRRGRYAYGNQPRIALWNLARLAETLLPLLSDQEDVAIADTEAALAAFTPQFERSYQAGLGRKLGFSAEREGDAALASTLLDGMAVNQVDFTLFFRRLGDAQLEGEGDAAVRALFADPSAYDAWVPQWRARLRDDPQDVATRGAAMRAVNPAYIPRNHRVEAVIKAAVEQEDFAPFDELVAVLARPFDDQPALSHYGQPPAADERVLQTFCGT
jgi:uncharacterized protein YdiU (UPF0061 family)